MATMSTVEAIDNPIDREISDRVNGWIVARDGDDNPQEPVPADPALARDRPGVVFDFCGLAVWVDPTTPDGKVEARQMTRIA